MTCALTTVWYLVVLETMRVFPLTYTGVQCGFGFWKRTYKYVFIFRGGDKGMKLDSALSRFKKAIPSSKADRGI